MNKSLDRFFFSEIIIKYDEMRDMINFVLENYFSRFQIFFLK